MAMSWKLARLVLTVIAVLTVGFAFGLGNALFSVSLTSPIFGTGITWQTLVGIANVYTIWALWKIL